MTRHNERVVFIDGFAGPGEYAGGEEGSPLIALRALYDHHFKEAIKAEVAYVFVENNEERAGHLESLLEEIRAELPANASFQVVTGDFEETVGQALSDLAREGKQLAPAFVMVDPFGVSGLPMELIGRILENPKSEVYVSFMYESMHRFVGAPEFEEHLDSLFGTNRWRAAIDLEGDERRRFLYDLYEAQLKAAGAEHVIHFDLYEGNRLIYGIFFGTQHIKGSDKMKEAIWKVAPDGGFEFRGSKSGQLELNVSEPEFEVLRAQLLERFSGQIVDVRNVLDFVASDATDFHRGQVKRPVLKPMEKEELIEVVESPRKRSYGYPDGTKIRFLGDTAAEQDSIGPVRGE